MPFKNPNPGARRSFGFRVVTIGKYRMLKVKKCTHKFGMCYFILERCLLLIHKHIIIQTTNAIKDVANEGDISPEVMGILAQNIT